MVITVVCNRRYSSTWHWQRTPRIPRQLRALCDAADEEAFILASREQLTDQRTPAFVVQLGNIVETVVQHGVTQNLLSKDGLRAQASWIQIGRYVKFVGNPGVLVWIGIHLERWRKEGTTPLWLFFAGGKSEPVRRCIEPWAAQNNISTTSVSGVFYIALDVLAGEEEQFVVRRVLAQLCAIFEVLIALPIQPVAASEEIEIDGVHG